MTTLSIADGHPIGFPTILRDRTDVHAAVERRDLLLSEMVYRIANAFTLVQVVATMTRRQTETVVDFDEMFGTRLKVLLLSNDALTRDDWRDASLEKVMRNALAALLRRRSRSDRFQGPQRRAERWACRGREPRLPQTRHRRRKTWLVVRPGRSCRGPQRWEHGGPKAQPPTRRGFGTQLLSKEVSGSGTVKLM